MQTNFNEQNLIEKLMFGHMSCRVMISSDLPALDPIYLGDGDDTRQGPAPSSQMSSGAHNSSYSSSSVDGFDLGGGDDIRQSPAPSSQMSSGAHNSSSSDEMFEMPATRTRTRSSAKRKTVSSSPICNFNLMSSSDEMFSDVEVLEESLKQRRKTERQLKKQEVDNRREARLRRKAEKEEKELAKRNKRQAKADRKEMANQGLALHEGNIIS